MLGRRIAARPRPPATVRDLEIALLEEWNSIPQSLIDNLIASMANSYKRAFDDGPDNFKPWSSDEDDTELALSSSFNNHTTPTGGRFSSCKFSVHRCPTRWVFSGTEFKLVTKQATIRYLYHSATTATSCSWAYRKKILP
ncbi:hypothetical protein TNCV_1029051 [Trichonephila clavipes]|nr:hypothetical protein TNCV_1029051 [Trichonephila clavipes]